jgi:4-hydroxybenzoate polyprenyltransferase
MTTAPMNAPTIAQSSVALARDIKLSHTVFALPFALLAAFLAARGLPAWGMVGLVLGCMVTARTFAMSANRLLDAPLDAANPRTRNRAMPAGRISRPFVLAVIALCAAMFVGCAAGFLIYGNAWPLILSPVVLGWLGCYPLMKRYTQLCHYYLGAALGLAPVGAYLAVAGQLTVAPILIAVAVLTWTAGFDILYACQDYKSDLETGTFSVPARLGIPRAFWVARASHVASLVLLASVPQFAPLLGGLYYGGVGLAALLLIVEHCVVSPSDLSRLNLAFFTLNGCVSLVIGAAGIADVLRHA